MKKLFEKLNKLGYTFTNKRVLGNPDHTSLETREKDLTQEYALIVMWLYEKHGIWVNIGFSGDESCYLMVTNKIGEIKWNEKGFKSPTEAYLAAIEYTLKEMI